VHRFQLPRLGSEFASDVGKSDRLFSSSRIYFVGSVLALRFFSQYVAQNISQQSASFTFGWHGGNYDRRGSFLMQLKMWILSGTAIALWLAPLTALDKKVGWHKSIQGLSLGAAVACAVSAGNIARRLVEENEIEELKTRAIKADVVDEISTSIYVSQAQRQQEAEAILASPSVDLESAREALEVLYTKGFEEEAKVSTPTTMEPSELDQSLYAEICKSREAGKTNTWIIENVLKMKGRKFGEGKAKLQELLSKFESESQ
jgi:hypothetical protein